MAAPEERPTDLGTALRKAMESCPACSEMEWQRSEAPNDPLPEGIVLEVRYHCGATVHLTDRNTLVASEGCRQSLETACANAQDEAEVEVENNDARNEGGD